MGGIPIKAGPFQCLVFQYPLKNPQRLLPLCCPSTCTHHCTRSDMVRSNLRRAMKSSSSARKEYIYILESWNLGQGWDSTKMQNIIFCIYLYDSNSMKLSRKIGLPECSLVAQGFQTWTINSMKHPLKLRCPSMPWPVASLETSFPAQIATVSFFHMR